MPLIPFHAQGVKRCQERMTEKSGILLGMLVRWNVKRHDPQGLPRPKRGTEPASQNFVTVRFFCLQRSMTQWYNSRVLDNAAVVGCASRW